MKLLKVILLLIIAPVFVMSNSNAQTKENPATISMAGPSVGVAWGFSYGVDGPPEIFLPQLNKMNVHLTKLYLFWQELEPVKGQYNWGAVDTFLMQLTPADEALISVFSASSWATKIASPPIPASVAKSPDEYYRFIYDLVKHCKGKIKLWQNDSEPNNPVYWNGTSEEFSSQLKVFYRAVKDADPQAKVVMGGYDGLFNPPGMPEIPGQRSGLAFFSKAIREAADYFDIFDVRLYANPYTIPARVEYFKKELADSAHGQPIICTEYNGPGFFGFPVNFKYIGQIVEWQRVVATHDSVAYAKMKDPVADMYDSINTLAPQTQMFMMGCSKELNDKYDRLQCRDIVMRNVLAFSAGIQKTMYWCLFDNTDNKYDLMTLMFGKNKLLEYHKGKVVKEYPEVAVFKRMTGYLNHIKTIRRIDVPGKELLYLFEITGTDDRIKYVAWEKRDPFSGEDQAATNYMLPLPLNKVKAIDIFGNAVDAKTVTGNVEINLSDTPVFIQANK
ncbi:MAG TPA: hypothetical protein VIJ92_13455 [Ginsengibacter sp.]